MARRLIRRRGDNLDCAPQWGYNARMEYSESRPIGDILKERQNIDPQRCRCRHPGRLYSSPEFLLKSEKFQSGDKIAYAMLLKYAWQNDFCFPGQVRLAEDIGLHERNVRRLSQIPRNQRPADHSSAGDRARPTSTNSDLKIRRTLMPVSDRTNLPVLNRTKVLGPRPDKNTASLLYKSTHLIIPILKILREGMHFSNKKELN